MGTRKRVGVAAALLYAASAHAQTSSITALPDPGTQSPTTINANFSSLDTAVDAHDARLDNLDALVGVQTDVLRFISGGTTNAVTEVTVDIDITGWDSSTRDAIEFYDGAQRTYLIAVPISDAPTSGQVLKWDAVNKETKWEADGGGTAVEVDIDGNGTPDSSGATRIIVVDDNLGIAQLTGDLFTLNLGLMQALGYVIGSASGPPGTYGVVAASRADTPNDGECLVWKAGDTGEWEPCPGGGSSDVDLVGNCTSGDCFDGTSDGGTQLTLYAVEANTVVANVAGTFDVSRPITATSFTADDPGDGNRVVTLQDNTSACPDPSSGSTSLCGIGGSAYVRDSGATSRRIPVVIASDATVVDPTSIASEACATVVSATATGAATTDVISWTPASDISGVTGYAPVDTGGVIIYPYATANLVNFKVCNPTLGAIDPGAITLNWKIIR